MHDELRKAGTSARNDGYELIGRLRMTKTVRTPAVTAAEINHFLQHQIHEMFRGIGLSVSHVAYGEVHVCQEYKPIMSGGGTGGVNGPVIMALTDVAMFLAARTALGWKSKAATFNLNFNFIRGLPTGQDVRAEARLHRVGKRMIIGETYIYGASEDEPSVHVTGSFALQEPKA